LSLTFTFNVNSSGNSELRSAVNGEGMFYDKHYVSNSDVCSPLKISNQCFHFSRLLKFRGSHLFVVGI